MLNKENLLSLALAFEELAIKLRDIAQPVPSPTTREEAHAADTPKTPVPVVPPIMPPLVAPDRKRPAPLIRRAP